MIVNKLVQHYALSYTVKLNSYMIDSGHRRPPGGQHRTTKTPLSEAGYRAMHTLLCAHPPPPFT